MVSIYIESGWKTLLSISISLGNEPSGFVLPIPKPVTVNGIAVNYDKLIFEK